MVEPHGKLARDSSSLRRSSCNTGKLKKQCWLMIPGFSRQFFGAQDRRFGLTQIFYPDFIISVIRDDRCKDALHNEMLADYDFFLVALK